ncbi:hypothetical protein QR685DRAFT_522737 [Neurospora intermedia]|uniref:Uncharacterized protein n=1 Tax=Neurospora intermedia TaxID=5142 RepID=A0ABR3DBM6_NEUIN
MSNEAEIEWQSRPAGEIADESQRLLDLLTAWDILDRPMLVSELQRVHTEVSEMDSELVIQDAYLGTSVDVLFSKVGDAIAAKKSEFRSTKVIRENAKWASYIKTFAFGREHEEKAKEAHKNERKEAYKQALIDKGLPADDDQCEENAKREMGWSWFDLEDSERGHFHIQRELKGLKEWNAGVDAKPPTPVLDRLPFCLQEAGTGMTLNRFVEVCTWDALWKEQRRLEEEKNDDDDDDDEKVDGMSAPQIFAAIWARETALDEYLDLERISPDTYEQSCALLNLVRAHIEKSGVPDSAV